MADWLTNEEREALDALDAGPINRLQQELLGEAVERLVAGRSAIESAVADACNTNAGMRRRIEALEHLVANQRDVVHAADKRSLEAMERYVAEHDECNLLRAELDAARARAKGCDELEAKNLQLRADCDRFELEAAKAKGELRSRLAASGRPPNRWEVRAHNLASKLREAEAREALLTQEQNAVMEALPSLGMWEAPPHVLAAEVARRLKSAENCQLTTKEIAMCVEALRGYAGYAAKARAAEMEALSGRLEDLAWLLGYGGESEE